MGSAPGRQDQKVTLRKSSLALRRGNAYVCVHVRLWSRLILHFWALEVERDSSITADSKEAGEPDPVGYLQRAYEQTLSATSSPNEWLGTTTACAALLHHTIDKSPPTPKLYVTNLGDSQILVLRPKDQEVLFKTTEQWHWFDCPRQLGTNSPDTPEKNAVMDKVDVEEGDIVLAMSDGVIDNLWEHEVVQSVIDSIRKWETGEGEGTAEDRKGGAGGGMLFVAEELMKAARVIAEDPFAESPFMERAVEEGLAMEGGMVASLPLQTLLILTKPTGKLDDISVVAGLCKKRKG
jgi:protein phosphatase PTC7